jgi:hypothetical protein
VARDNTRLCPPSLISNSPCRGNWGVQGSSRLPAACQGQAAYTVYSQRYPPGGSSDYSFASTARSPSPLDGCIRPRPLGDGHRPSPIPRPHQLGPQGRPLDHPYIARCWVAFGGFTSDIVGDTRSDKLTE